MCSFMKFINDKHLNGELKMDKNTASSDVQTPKEAVYYIIRKSIPN